MKKWAATICAACLSAVTLIGCAAENNGEHFNNTARNQNSSPMQAENINSNNQGTAGYNVRNGDNLNNPYQNRLNVTNENENFRGQNAGNNGAKAQRAAGKGKFKDVEQGAWYTENIQWANQLGMIDGMPNGEFQPKKPLTRAEVVALLKKLADQGYLNVPTNTTTDPGTTDGGTTTDPGTTDGGTTTDPGTTDGGTTTDPGTTDGGTTTEPAPAT